MRGIIKAYPLALSRLIDKVANDTDLLEHVLSSFSCSIDEDIQNFLRYRAVDFEKLLK